MTRFRGSSWVNSPYENPDPEWKPEPGACKLMSAAPHLVSQATPFLRKESGTLQCNGFLVKLAV